MASAVNSIYYSYLSYDNKILKVSMMTTCYWSSILNESCAYYNHGSLSELLQPTYDPISHNKSFVYTIPFRYSPVIVDSWTLTNVTLIPSLKCQITAPAFTCCRAYKHLPQSESPTTYSMFILFSGQRKHFPLSFVWKVWSWSNEFLKKNGLKIRYRGDTGVFLGNNTMDSSREGGVLRTIIIYLLTHWDCSSHLF